jgi:hypothetical protein
MQLNTIRCEAVNVRTDSGTCPGIAKTQQGEVHKIGARTPASGGMCCQAFVALSSVRHVMMLTEKMDWETNPFFDVTCPHGAVTFRLSRQR